MPVITLPDGSQRRYDKPVSIAEVAASIGPGLAKVAIAGKIDDKLFDVSHVIDADALLVIITSKDKDGLEIIRHSTAHLLAQAVKQLHPEAQVTIGPVIEDGFYYDFVLEKPLTPEDLIEIETKMHELAKQDLSVQRIVSSRAAAIDFFRQQGEEYKAKIIEDIPEDQTITLYQQGDFTDLCRGPHVPNTCHLSAFKLMKVAGAYWRGDSNNAMLQRVYGTAWANSKDLNAYLLRLEEAAKRDHRKVGKLMDLFHVQEEAPGMVFWHANGWVIFQQIEQYIRDLLREHDYQEVRTPQIVERSLWEKSGHWEKFHNEMFITTTEDRDYAIKPMNCPCHIQIFNQGLKSYRDLPLRMAEFGSCHRREPSGALHGIMRVRNFIQDDAHIFCTEEQIQTEVTEFMNLLFKVYADFGFQSVIIKLSTRPPIRVGDDATWNKAEAGLKAALELSGVDWELAPGEGAFYGPKIEFSLRDSIGRIWQCGTIQLDFLMPERLGAEYRDETGNKKIPVMLHRAILGSVERFIGILLEECAGILPVWLAPVQAVILNITRRQAVYVETLVTLFRSHGLRIKPDLRNEKIGFKIREHTLQRTPYLLVVGDREVETQTISVRTQNGEDLGSMSPEAFVDWLMVKIKRRSRLEKLED